jgi:predicted nucleotidyltransferase
MATPFTGTGQEPVHVQWPTARARNWSRTITEQFPQIDALVVLGSRARGCAQPTSDVDLVVVYHGERPRIRPPPEADVRWVQATEIEQRVLAGDEFLGWAVALGAAIYDPRDVWSGAVMALRDRVPLPSADAARERARRARLLAHDLLQAGDDDAGLEQLVTMLTQESRAALCSHGVFPASRPELAQQLRTIGEHDLADQLNAALTGHVSLAEAMSGRRVAS